MPGAQFQALIGSVPLQYQFFRWTVTDIISTAGNAAACYNAQVSVDAGVTWLPIQTMTSDVAPSPLVASAISEVVGNEAYKAFDQNNTTYWVGTANADVTGHFAVPQWLQIDLGSGNSIIVPSQFRLAFFNSGVDLTWKNFTFKASQTGAFAGEEVTLKTISGQTTQTNQVNVVYNIP